MNKTYIQPSLMVIRLKNDCLLNSASLGLNGSQASEWGAKGGGTFWSDDEPDEYDEYED